MDGSLNHTNRVRGDIMNHLRTTVIAGLAGIAALAVPAAAQSVDAASIAAAPSPAADVTVVTGCLYGGPSWMASWTISSSYRFSTVPAGIESGDTTTHQWDQTSTTLEVIVNVGASNAPEYEVVSVTAEKPAGCDTTPTSTSATTIPVAVAPPPIPPPASQCPPEQSFVLDTCVPDPTIPSSTTIPATPPAPPVPIPTGCAPGEYPQGSTGFEECGPVDLCSDDGQTRNWSIAACASPVTASTPGAQLPATGLVEVWMAGAALMVIALGFLLRLVARDRRYRAVRATDE